MTTAPPTLDPDAIRTALPVGAVIGRTVQVFAEVDSTNDVVARAGRSGAEEGLVVFAESQRAGRGRQGRRWSSALGLGLWFSVLLRPREMTGSLALLAAVAVAEAVEATGGRPAGVKWPNDVVLDGRKVAGVLIEAATEGTVVVGIGVNANQGAEDFPPELHDRAGSLARSLGRPVDRVALAGRLLARLDTLYRGWPENAPDIVAGCEARNILRGKRLRSVNGAFTGTVEGFAPDGGLLLRTGTDGERRIVHAGEVILAR